MVKSKTTKRKKKPKWLEKDGVIYFSVTSDGTSGEEWVKRLRGNRFRVGCYARHLLCSPSFVPTSDITTKVAILKSMLFKDNDLVKSKICAEAKRRKLSKPNAEVACLIREKFSDADIKAMGLICIVAMHESSCAMGYGPYLLDANRYDDGRWLGTYDVGPGNGWCHGYGFAFAVSQTQS